MSSGEFLSIEPQELRFPFELKKHISCSLQLLNKSDNHVAFKVKTINPNKYCVRPNTGVVFPRSTYYVTVMIQAHGEAPPDSQCKDNSFSKCYCQSWSYWKGYQSDMVSTSKSISAGQSSTIKARTPQKKIVNGTGTKRVPSLYRVPSQTKSSTGKRLHPRLLSIHDRATAHYGAVTG